jgi:hypothetical protein
MSARPDRARHFLLCLALLGAAVPAADASAAAASRHPYFHNRVPYRANPRFVVTYVGSGRWRTDYHATPPNDGGDPDTNDAHDASTQAWLITLAGSLAIPPCAEDAGRDACADLRGLDGATGPTGATGRIRHTHVDGLYPQLDATDRCDVSARTPRDGDVDAAVGLEYSPALEGFAVTAYEPVTTVLRELPQACPGRGDPIDRMLDNYFTPGFSFDPAFGAERWFRSRRVVVPTRVFHHATEIMIPLRDTDSGRPPADCAVEHPEYERCTTGGSWAGVLIFRTPAP